MSRFYKLSHTIWHCQYHIVWTPKYRFRILKGDIKKEVENCIRAYFEQLKCVIIEMNVQADHVHLITMVPPKISVATYVGMIKGRSANRLFSKYPNLRQKPYW
jgi:putative transposase